MNLIEEYYEYLFEYRSMLIKIQDEFHAVGFKTTYKDDKRVAVIKENTYIEFYQDSDDEKYVFSIHHNNKQQRLFTNSFEKLEGKTREVIKLIGE